MRPISEFFLAEMPEIATGATGQPETKKITPTTPRVPSSELEATYAINPIVFNSVNKICQTIMAAHHEITAKDKKIQKWFTDFTDNLGNSGADITWEELLGLIFKQQCIFGKSFVENIFNKRHNRIVDWDIIDPKTMDYAKDSNNKIVVDKFGRPVGYFQILPYGYTGSLQQSRADLPPKVVPPRQGVYWIFLSPDRIAQIKLYLLGSGFYPIGIVEPIYRNSLRQLNMEDAMANSAYRHGFPIMWSQLGDLNHEPTPNQINSMLDKLKDLTNKSEIATPYYYQLHILESKKSEKLREHLEYYTAQEIAGMGIPVAFATGGVSKDNKATLAKQDALYQLTLRDIVNKTSIAIEKYMFKPICDLEGFKEVPTIRWDLLAGTDELDRKARRLLKYVEAGILSPDLKISDFIKRLENLE